MNPSDTKLKPCPFCGGPPYVHEVFALSGKDWTNYNVYCSICGAHQTNFKSTEELAIAAWNHRAYRSEL